MASFSCLAHFSAKPPARPSGASPTVPVYRLCGWRYRRGKRHRSTAVLTITQSRCSGDCASGWGYPLGASSPLVRQAMSPPIQDYGTLAAARKHCEPLLKATPTVRLQATRDKQNSTQPSSRTPDSIYLAVGTTQWSAPRSPQNEATTRDRSTLVTTATSAPSQPSAECRRSRSKQQLHGAGKQCTDSASERHSSQTPHHSPT